MTNKKSAKKTTKKAAGRKLSKPRIKRDKLPQPQFRVNPKTDQIEVVPGTQWIDTLLPKTDKFDGLEIKTPTPALEQSHPLARAVAKLVNTLSRIVSRLTLLFKRR
jgi:hypothetical protein